MVVATKKLKGKKILKTKLIQDQKEINQIAASRHLEKIKVKHGRKYTYITGKEKPQKKLYPISKPVERIYSEQHIELLNMIKEKGWSNLFEIETLDEDINRSGRIDSVQFSATVKNVNYYNQLFKKYLQRYDIVAKAKEFFAFKIKTSHAKANLKIRVNSKYPGGKILAINPQKLISLSGYYPYEYMKQLLTLQLDRFESIIKEANYEQN